MADEKGLCFVLVMRTILRNEKLYRLAWLVYVYLHLSRHFRFKHPQSAG